MDHLGYSHKEALAEAEIMIEDEYDGYYSDNYKVNIEDQFSVAGRQYEVLNFDQNKQEVLVRDITNSDEENLPLYEIFDIPFVYHRTQAIKDLRNVELQDFLNAPVDFINVTFGEGNEETVYTYGYLYLKDAVIPRQNRHHPGNRRACGLMLISRSSAADGCEPCQAGNRAALSSCGPSAGGACLSTQAHPAVLVACRVFF